MSRASGIGRVIRRFRRDRTPREHTDEDMNARYDAKRTVDGTQVISWTDDTTGDDLVINKLSDAKNNFTRSFCVSGDLSDMEDSYYKYNSSDGSENINNKKHKFNDKMKLEE